MSAIKRWEDGFLDWPAVSTNYPAECGVEKDESCFLCGDPLHGPVVYWCGTGAMKNGLLTLHSRCALHLAANLAKDAYEAETGLKIPASRDHAVLLECMGHNWRARIADERASRQAPKSSNALSPEKQRVVLLLRETLFTEEPGSSVYFVQQAPDGPIKIGISRDVQGRIAALQSSSAHPLRLLGQIPGGRALEAHLHELFHERRLQGEWFEPVADILSLMEQLIETAATVGET